MSFVQLQLLPEEKLKERAAYCPLYWHLKLVPNCTPNKIIFRATHHSAHLPLTCHSPNDMNRIAGKALRRKGHVHRQKS
jgi:hypothetical protein